MTKFGLHFQTFRVHLGSVLYNNRLQLTGRVLWGAGLPAGGRRRFVRASRLRSGPSVYGRCTAAGSSSPSRCAAEEKESGAKFALEQRIPRSG